MGGDKESVEGPFLFCSRALLSSFLSLLSNPWLTHQNLDLASGDRAAQVERGDVERLVPGGRVFFFEAGRAS